jgi:predicted kinase
MDKKIKPLIVLLAGPPATGKTTLAKMLSRHYKCKRISEDELAKKLYPDKYTQIEEDPDKMKEIFYQLFAMVKDIYSTGNSVIVELINADKDFVEKIRKSFSENLFIRILWPPVETTILRDKERKGWTSGESAIRKYYQKYQSLEAIIGKENYIDNSQQTPEQTLKNIVKTLGLE